MKNRIAGIDLARALAIAAVLFVHTAERSFAGSPAELYASDTAMLVLRNSCIALGRLGVPLFLMISGYLLLDRDYSSSKKIFAFYRRSLLPLIVTAEVWTVIYGVVNFANGVSGYDFLSLLREMFFFQSSRFSHMWYIPMIIGLYIAVPFVSNALKNISASAIAVPAAVIFAAGFVFDFIEIFGDALDLGFGAGDIGTLLDKTFLGGVYGLYLVMGLLIKRGDFSRFKTPAAAALAAVCLAGTVAAMTGFAAKGYDLHLWYNFPPLFISSVCIMLLVCRAGESHSCPPRMISAAKSVAAVSFGMFFIHKPLQDTLSPLFRSVSHPALNFLLSFAALFAASYLIALLLSKIPYVNAVLLNIKQKPKHKS